MARRSRAVAVTALHRWCAQARSKLFACLQHLEGIVPRRMEVMRSDEGKDDRSQIIVLCLRCQCE